MNRIVLPALAALLAAATLASAEEPAASPPAAAPAAPAAVPAEPAPPPAALPPEPAPSQAAPGGASPLARLLLLPDVSAIGRAALVYDGLDVGTLSPRAGTFSSEGEPAAVLEEVELGLQSVVDPYARADVFVSFGPAGADVEEATLTTLSLPAGLQLRAGKLFTPFGRLNAQHAHVWDFADAPLARERILLDAGGEVLSGPGLDLAWLAPVPWFLEVHLAGQDTVVAEGGDPALTGLVRVLQYLQLGDATTVGVGLSAARRDEGRGAFRDLGGVDVYLKHRPPGGRSYASLQGELYARRFRGREGGSDLAGYAQAFFRRGAYLGYGVRFDAAPSAAPGIEGTEQRFSAVGSWFLSEFQRLRLQVSYDRLPDGKDGVEALLHLEFGIGAHGAHPF